MVMLSGEREGRERKGEDDKEKGKGIGLLRRVRESSAVIGEV